VGSVLVVDLLQACGGTANEDLPAGYFVDNPWVKNDSSVSFLGLYVSMLSVGCVGSLVVSVFFADGMVHLPCAGRTLLGGQRRRMSSYTSNYSRRLEQAEAGSKLESEDKQVDLLRQLNKVDPESVIRWFESRPLPHLSSAAMAEYVKALVKVDRLDESALLKTLQRGNYWHCLKSLGTS
jgi:hypothetical protein